MKQLLNTLYVTSEDVYLTLDGENIVANRNKEAIARYPLHTLNGIISFSYAGTSPSLMGACCERGISLAFCSPRGKFLGRITGENNGNVLLRREQYRISDNAEQSCKIAKTMIFGKIYNSRQVIERTKRDHSLRVDTDKLSDVSKSMKELLPVIMNEVSLENLRGLEGVAASSYFGVFDDLILNNKNIFYFHNRSRRPPLDPVNSMLSFGYSLLAHDCAAACESVGLDSYVGFLHRDRSGRSSLALDLMEEFRPCMVDRFVLSLINNRIFKEKDFNFRECGGVEFTEKARKLFLSSWQEKKREILTHPFLQEKMHWGLVPYVQAQLLSRYLRGELDEYPPFLWK